MNQSSLEKKLYNLNIGGIRYYETIGSTNDEALVWATQGAPDLSIVIADEQTAGRGRLNRKWFTPPNSALAFSLILRPPSPPHLSRMVGLAALSIADSCIRLGLAPRIKWPNDILINGKKVSGILIETVWSGDRADSLAIGMGVNLRRDSIPPDENLKFPATSIEDELNRPVDREDFLYNILSALKTRREQIETPEFMNAWNERLAFIGEQVYINSDAGESISGMLANLDDEGCLVLSDAAGGKTTVRFGDVSLRPAS